MEFVAFILIGFSISLLSGFFGIGGGFVLTPVLLLMGYSPIEAISTSLLYTIGTSIAGVYAHFKMGNIQWKAAMVIGISGILATQAAYPFVSWLEASNYAKIVIPILYLTLLTFLAYKMLKKENSASAKKGGSSFIALIVIGIIGGFLSTTLGVGGGFIIVPLLIASGYFTSRKAVATSLTSVILIVAAGFITYAVNNPVHYETGLLLIGGAIFGSQIGAHATKYIENRSIQRLLGILYIITIISLLLNISDHSLAGLIALGCYTIFVNFLLVIKLVQRKVRPSY